MKILTAAFLMVTSVVMTDSSAGEPSGDPAFFLVRHAEKAAGSDPALTADGSARAARLARQLEAAGIVAIYSTPTRRTQETAAPLAEALGIEVRPYDAFDLGAVADDLRARGETALIVGHSNTTPRLAKALGGGEQALIPEDDYDRLYCIEGDRLVMLTAGGAPLDGPGCP